MNNYEEKQQARAERFRELAQKNREGSTQARQYSDKISSMIPFGQPILVGHHSEGRHRRDLKRIQNSMDKSIELQDKAKYYEQRAESVENNNSISSDDPEAIEKLKQKLKGLEENREKFKEHNKKARKEGTEKAPAYILQNLAGNIRNVKLRIEQLEKVKVLQYRKVKIKDVLIKFNVEDNRVQIEFNDIPEKELRTELKRNGFKWSPSNKAWQRSLNEWSYRLAQEIIIAHKIIIENTEEAIQND